MCYILIMIFQNQKFCRICQLDSHQSLSLYHNLMDEVCCVGEGFLINLRMDHDP